MLVKCSIKTFPLASFAQAIICVASLVWSQGCTTAQFNVVKPLIAANKNWFLDAASWLVYRESLFGPRFSVYISPHLDSDQSNTPLRIQMTFGNDFDAVFSLIPGRSSWTSMEKTTALRRRPVTRDR